MKLRGILHLLFILPVGALFLFGCGGNDNVSQSPSGSGNNATSSLVIKFAKLDGSLAIPASSLAALGTLAVDTTTGALSGTLIFRPTAPILTSQGTIPTGPTITAIEVHEGPPGTNGALVTTLQVNRTGGVLSIVPAGTVLTPALVNSFVAGNLYFSVKTVAHPEGEVRGQINSPPPVTGIGYNILLNGSEEVPPVISGAFGACDLFVDPTNGVVRGSLQIQPIPPTLITEVDVHEGEWGTNGGVIVKLAGANNFWRVPSDTILTPAQTSSFLVGNFYVNVHTVAHPEGEIRGQLDNYEGASQNASL
jgi:CHRD domain